MEEEKIPQSWIGWDVILCRTGTEDWELVNLREVSELGLAYVYKTGEVEGQPVFVPWNSVNWMRPPIPEDLETSETEAG
jgi:hypothetical protein